MSMNSISGVSAVDYTGRAGQLAMNTGSAAAAADEAAGKSVEAPAGDTERGGASGNQTGSPDFSTVFAEAMRDGAMRATATASASLGGGMTGVPGIYLPSQDQGIEQAIIEAASSGQLDDAQVALFMLMMMMQTGQEGEFSMLMQMMASMISQLQDDKDTLRSNMLASGFDPFVRDEIDRHIFNWMTPDGWETGQVTLPTEVWQPTSNAVTSSVDDRSPGLYRSVINQFKVETSARYRPFRDGYTYCNIFMWDVTRAMGAEVPHYTDPATGEPRYYPDIKGAASMGAIATDEWLRTHGETYGWREADAETAQMHANEGKPAITSAGSLGHVQVICPSMDGGFDPARGVTIAQAGSIVTNYRHISSIYSAKALANNVRYWIHE